MFMNHGIYSHYPTVITSNDDKRLHNELENHHAINSSKSTISMGHFQVRKLLVYSKDIPS